MYLSDTKRAVTRLTELAQTRLFWLRMRKGQSAATKLKCSATTTTITRRTNAVAWRQAARNATRTAAGRPGDHEKVSH